MNFLYGLIPQGGIFEGGLPIDGTQLVIGKDQWCVIAQSNRHVGAYALFLERRRDGKMLEFIRIIEFDAREILPLYFFDFERAQRVGAAIAMGMSSTYRSSFSYMSLWKQMGMRFTTPEARDMAVEHFAAQHPQSPQYPIYPPGVEPDEDEG